MNTMRHILFLILLFSVQLGQACDDAKIGYWWYCEEPEQEDLPPQREPLPPPPTHQAMMQMHPDDISHMQEAYLKEAVWQTTPQNVHNYYQVLDVARRKSLAFMNVTKFVMMNNPELDAHGQYAKTSPGKNELNKHKRAQLQATLSHHKHKFGLILFTKSSCVYCRTQYSILGGFSDRHGWPIKTIDIDQNPLAASRFNVTTVPVTITVKKGEDKWMPVAVGEEALTTIEMNIYRAIRYLNGDTSPSQFLQMEYQDGSISDPENSLQEIL